MFLSSLYRRNVIKPINVIFSSASKLPFQDIKEQPVFISEDLAYNFSSSFR
jgi:hypothetical protein